MSRATDLAEQLTQWTCTCLPAFKDRNLYDPDCVYCMVNPEATEAATLLLQQEAVIKQCVESLEDGNRKLDWFVDSYPHDLTITTEEFFFGIKAALAAAKECLK